VADGEVLQGSATRLEKRHTFAVWMPSAFGAPFLINCSIIHHPHSLPMAGVASSFVASRRRILLIASASRFV
jgi:RsiW-degrading membrane proteinase PrsW (M82 family)